MFTNFRAIHSEDPYCRSLSTIGRWKQIEIRPQSYVNNQGLSDSLEHRLIQLQLDGPSWLSPDRKVWRLSTEEWQSRLAMISSVRLRDSVSIPTQAQLEKSESRRSWNVRYLSHGWHRYVGRFPPQVVRAILNSFRIARPEVVLDPFAGSGTALVEAKLMGIDGIGVEICPLSQLIADVKCRLNFPSKRLANAWSAVEHAFESGRPGKLRSYSGKVEPKLDYRIPDFSNRDRWFSRGVLSQLTLLLSAVQELQDSAARKFLCVAVSASMRSLANTDVDVVRTEYRKTPRINVDVVRVVRQKVMRMIADLEIYEKMDLPRANVSCKLGDARKLDLPSSSVDLVITSPPYGIESISYLRTYMLNYRVLSSILETSYDELGHEMIGTDFVLDWSLDNTDLISPTAQELFRGYSNERGKDDKRRVAQMIQYYQDMEKSLAEMARVLKKDGHVAIIVGDKKLFGKPLPTHTILQEIAARLGLQTREVLPAKLVCNNPTSQTPWSGRMIRDEYILFLEKN